MRQTGEENSKFYDAWAKTYDEDINSTIYIDELYFHKFWGNLNNKKALEIGCGSGRNTQKLAQANHNITAIDISKNMDEVWLLERDGNSDMYFFKGERWLFYKDKLKFIDGKWISGEPLSTM